MKKQLLPLLALLALSACTSPTREERIAEIIREDLNKKIANFAGYEPLETEISDSIFSSARISSRAYELAQEIYTRNEKIEKLNLKIDLEEEVAAGSGMSEYNRGEILYYRDKIKEVQAEIDSLKGDIRQVDASIEHTFAGYAVGHSFRLGKGESKQILRIFYVINDATGEVAFTREFNDQDIALGKIINEALNEK